MYETEKYATAIGGSIGVRAESDVPRVSREMGVIQKLLAEHNEQANLIETRLNAVLRPAGAVSADGDQKDPRAATSPLTSDLEAFRKQLERLLGQYRDIADRLEV